MEGVIGNLHFENLDEIDLKIIDALGKDGRVAFAQIAEQLNVSPGMMRQRYNRLVEEGFLKVVAITNPLRMGLKTMAMIGIRVDGDKMVQVAEKILRSMRWCFLPPWIRPAVKTSITASRWMRPAPRARKKTAPLARGRCCRDR